MPSVLDETISDLGPATNLVELERGNEGVRSWYYRQIEPFWKGNRRGVVSTREKVILLLLSALKLLIYAEI